MPPDYKVALRPFSLISTDQPYPAAASLVYLTIDAFLIFLFFFLYKEQTRDFPNSLRKMCLSGRTYHPPKRSVFLNFPGLPAFDSRSEQFSFWFPETIYLSKTEESTKQNYSEMESRTVGKQSGAMLSRELPIRNGQC